MYMLLNDSSLYMRQLPTNLEVNCRIITILKKKKKTDIRLSTLHMHFYEANRMTNLRYIHFVLFRSYLFLHSRSRFPLFYPYENIAINPECFCKTDISQLRGQNFYQGQVPGKITTPCVRFLYPTWTCS